MVLHIKEYPPYRKTIWTDEIPNGCLPFYGSSSAVPSKSLMRYKKNQIAQENAYDKPEILSDKDAGAVCLIFFIPSLPIQSAAV